VLEFSCDMMYEGQFNVLETRLPRLDRDRKIDADDLPELQRMFETTHERVYGYRLEGEPVEIEAMRLAAIGMTPPLHFPTLKPATGRAETAMRDVRLARFLGNAMETTVYDGPRLARGHHIVGPALIDHPTTTIKIATGWQGRVDEIGNLLMWRAGWSLETTLARLAGRPH
jgi:N-methylhydantoinase A